LVELHKVSQVQIMEEEMILENIWSRSAKLLKQQLGAKKISRTIDPAEALLLLIFLEHDFICISLRRSNTKHTNATRARCLDRRVYCRTHPSLEKKRIVHYILTTFCDIGADAAINARQR
jgi:hypothetical protein